MRMRRPDGMPKALFRKVRKEMNSERRKSANEGITALVEKLAPLSNRLPADQRASLIAALNHYVKVNPFIIVATHLAERLNFLVMDDTADLFCDLMRGGVRNTTDLRTFCRKLRSAIQELNCGSTLLATGQDAKDAKKSEATA